MKKIILLLLLVSGFVNAQGLTTEKEADLSKVPKEVLKNFRISEDKFNSATFIYNKDTNPRLHLYIGIRYKNPYLRLVCKYDGKNWIFFKNIVFLIDGIRYDYKPLSIKTEAYLGGVYEKADNLVFESEMELINALTNAKESIDIRFVGDNVYDCTFNIKKVKHLKETLDLYNSFK